MGKKYTILGGGIAGLATAIQLHKQGEKIALFEKNPKDNKQGHAFILMPNGLNALRKIGVYDETITAGHPITQFQLHNPEGELQTHQQLHGAVGIKRSTLINILSQALPPNMVQFNKGFSHFVKDKSDNIRKAYFTDGTCEHGDVFIGADGIWSKARNSVHSDFTLSPVRIREIVSITKAPEIVKQLNGTFMKFMDKNGGLAVGMLPCDEEHVVWFVQYDNQHPQLLNTTLSEQKAVLLNLIKDWANPIPAIIDKTNFEESYIWHTTDMQPLPSFHKNNLALIGDAAHVLLTLTSQGVSTALEDAICLTELIEGNKFQGMTETEMFKQYSFLRKETMEEYFQIGRRLKEQFLFPMQNPSEQNVPLAFGNA